MKTSKTKVVLLGTGNPNPDPSHSGPSVAVVVNNTSYIVDFGPGIVRQAAALTPNYGGVMTELEAHQLKKAFLTHLHSDHTAGYPDLILTPWVMGRDEPLEVYGPAGTQELTDYILKAYKADIYYRYNGLEPINNLGWQVKVQEINEGVIYVDKNLKVEAFKVKHGTWPNAFGFKFTTPDKVIVVSGDTAPCDNIINFSKGADILLHEVYFQKSFGLQESSWQKYHSTHHTSTVELAKIAQIAQPEILVTYHTLYWEGNEKDILEEIKFHYDGEVIIGSDLQIIV
jgi:ribonuclease Z